MHIDYQKELVCKLSQIFANDKMIPTCLDPLPGLSGAMETMSVSWTFKILMPVVEMIKCAEPLCDNQLLITNYYTT